MNDFWRSDYEKRLRATVTGADGSIPVVLGLCGTGRTTVLRHLRDDLGADACQYVNVERTATTPERFLEALVAASPFWPPAAAAAAPPTARAAFDATLAFFAGARLADGMPATFLLDGVLEFRTFESFPGLRRALSELLRTLSATPNRFVLASRYVSRASRVMAANPPFVVSPIECIEDAELTRMVAAAGQPCPSPLSGPGGAADALAPLVGRLCTGRPSVIRALVQTMAETPGVSADPVAALAAGFDPDGRVTAICCHTYELRLHRARGYGALKAVLEILAGEEPLTLTEVSLRLGRTPGSTKDYLSWLEDVDLVRSEQKRYRFRDPLLRLWVRLHCRPCPPAPEEIAREVGIYASRMAPATV